MGFFDKIKQGLAKTKSSLTGMFDAFTGANDEFYDELEERLILADAGVEISSQSVEKLRAKVREKGLRGTDDIKKELGLILTEVLSFENHNLVLETKPSVILVIGVNGVGKTTTIGKLAVKFTKEGKRVILCAGDTFRAAASEQLSIWASRAGVEIVKHKEGADPGAVIFDGITAAKSRGADIIICDTAGRLHNKTNLMKELSKINRIIDRELPDASRENLLVIDSTTGQNGLIQAKQFQEFAGISGVVLTKLDGTARGGIIFAVSGELKIPVKLVGVGETADDLLDFDAASFVEALLE